VREVQPVLPTKNELKKMYRKDLLSLVRAVRRQYETFPYGSHEIANSFTKEQVIQLIEKYRTDRNAGRV